MLTVLLQITSGGGIMDFMPLILIVVVMYFFMIRPQIKKQKQENNFRASLKMGDKIVTIGGIHGKIIEIGKSSLVIEVHAGSKLKIQKIAVSMSSGGELAEKK